MCKHALPQHYDGREILTSLFCRFNSAEMAHCSFISRQTEPQKYLVHFIAEKNVATVGIRTATDLPFPV
jgi:hypothetical protein